MYVVTGLTKMNQNKICMSVFDTVSNQYLRPIPPSTRYSQEDLQQLSLFSVVNLTPDTRTLIKQAPHNEDFPVKEQQPQPIGILSLQEQETLLRTISVQSTYDVFGFFNQQPILKQRTNRNYVVPGTGTHSLGTVAVNTVRVYYSFNKLKVDFTDLSGNIFTDIPFVSSQNIDPTIFTNQLSRCRTKYVRLSLARQFRPYTWDFDACFLQVSCIHGY